MNIIELKTELCDTEIAVAVHYCKSNVIIINLPGYNGGINGFGQKYVKLANYVIENDLGAVVRMANQFSFNMREYGCEVVDALTSVIKYAIQNSMDICGSENPDIYLIGTSAGGGAVALVAKDFPAVKKILLIAPAGGNVAYYGDCFKTLTQFTGDVAIVIGKNDEVVTEASGRMFEAAAIMGASKTLKYVSLPNCNHNFTGENNGRILSRAPFWAFKNDINFPDIKESCLLYTDI